MQSKRWLLCIPLLLFVGLMGIFFVAMRSVDPAASSIALPSARLGQPIPDFKLPKLSATNEWITAADLKGPFLLNVWASWCPGCFTEHPLLLALSESGVKWVGLNYKDSITDANDYLRHYQNPYQIIIFDQNGSLGLDLGVYGAPETYLVDELGIIQYRHVGVLTAKIWQEEFQPLWLDVVARAAEAVKQEG